MLDGVRPRKVLGAEQIAAAVGVSEHDARRTLPALELAGFVTAVDGGYRLRRKSDAPARHPLTLVPSPRAGQPALKIAGAPPAWGA